MSGRSFIDFGLGMTVIVDPAGFRWWLFAGQNTPESASAGRRWQCRSGQQDFVAAQVNDHILRIKKLQFAHSPRPEDVGHGRRPLLMVVSRNGPPNAAGQQNVFQGASENPRYAELGRLPSVDIRFSKGKGNRDDEALFLVLIQ